VSDPSWDWSRVGRCFNALADSHDAFSSEPKEHGIAPPLLDRWVEQFTHDFARRPPARVLELGAGSGRITEQLVGAGHRCILVDASTRMLQLASDRLAQTGTENVELRRTDAIEYLAGSTARFDLISAVGEVIAYVSSPARLLQMIGQRLEPTGQLVFTYMRREGLLPRLTHREVASDDGRVLVLLERANLPGGLRLWARAFADSELAAMMEGAGLQVSELIANPGEARGGLLAIPHPSAPARSGRPELHRDSPSPGCRMTDPAHPAPGEGRGFPNSQDAFRRPPTTAFPELAEMLASAVRTAELGLDRLQTRIHVCALPDCRGICCADGAYLEADEPDVIHTLARERADTLAGLGVRDVRRTVVPGHLRSGVHGSWKTAVRRVPDGSTGGRTACVFWLSDGRCALQVLSERSGLHPWHFKPAACWLHPLDILTEPGGKVRVSLFHGVPPPEGSPPSIGSAPCSQRRNTGRRAVEALSREIAFLSGLTGWDPRLPIQVPDPDPSTPESQGNLS
jgi:2-polyprenyl-3-methyl-5-hydroxy-6-metoxy-1,4-benzoquinol methylase